MFKGKLIEQAKYYSLRSKQSLIALLLSVMGAIVVNSYSFPIWTILILVLIYVFSFSFLLKYQKSLAKLTEKIIEISEEKILIKENNGKITETISIDPSDRIKVIAEYKLPQESLKDFQEELEGKMKRNFLIIEKNNHERRFDFEIPTHFMLNQLKKVIKQWQTEGFTIHYA